MTPVQTSAPVASPWLNSEQLAVYIATYTADGKPYVENARKWAKRHGIVAAYRSPRRPLYARADVDAALARETRRRRQAA